MSDNDQGGTILQGAPSVSPEMLAQGMAPQPLKPKKEMPKKVGIIRKMFRNAAQAHNAVGSCIRGLIFLWLAYWNLPGFFNAWNARCFARGGEGKTRGTDPDDKTQTMYPIIPVNVTCFLALKYGGVDPVLLAVISGVVTFFGWFTGASRVRAENRKIMWIVVGALAIAWASLKFGLGFDAIGSIASFLGLAHPNFEGALGYIFMLNGMIGLATFLCYLYGRTGNTMVLTQSQYVLHSLGGSNKADVDEHSVRTHIEDVMESWWMGIREIRIVGSAGTGNVRAAVNREGGTDDSRDAIVLHNVAAAGFVEYYCDQRLAIQAKLERRRNLALTRKVA
jgi:hypothetical protein